MVERSADHADLAPVALDKSRIEALIHQARGGSEIAVRQLLEACQAYLVSLAGRFVSAPLRVKFAPSDLVQETSLDAHRDFASFQGDRLEELLAWLRSILSHNLANARRRYQTTAKREISREISLDVHVGLGGEPRDNGLSPRSLLAAVEEQDRIEQSLQRLPSDQRQAILMRNRDNCSFAEIGVELQRSAQAARQLWVRAVVRLQRELADGPT